MKQYKLIIADDNQILRDMLNNIDWQTYNVSLIASCQNGQEVLSAAEKETPDLIITDVLMPIMDGVELAKQIKNKYSDVTMIFISAYDDFEYMQKAIKLDAYDYLLKPIDTAELIKTVLNVIEEKEKEAALREKVKSGIDLLRERFYIKLVESNSDISVFKDDMEHIGIHFNSEYYCCILFDIDNKTDVKTDFTIEEFELLLLRIKDIASTMLAKYEHHAFIIQNDIVSFIVGFDKPRIINEFYPSLEMIQNELKKRCHITVTVGIGNEKNSIDEIRLSYKEAKEAVKYRFLMGADKIIVYRDMMMTDNHQNPLESLKEEEELVKFLKFGIKEELDDFLDDYISRIYKKRLDKENLSTLVLSIAIKIYQTVVESGVESDIFTLSFVKDIYNEISKFDTYEQFLGWLKDIIRNAYIEIDTSRQNYASSIINKVIEYISDNYQEEDLTLESIAKKVSFSQSYISLLFKKETGINLFDYIIKLRMEKAMELLREGKEKISDIGGLVGYPNPSYFSNMFKKNTGFSPKDFRDQYRK